MNRKLPLLLTILWAILGALLVAGRAEAQYTQSNAGYVYAWNGFMPSKISRPYQSIIGQTGTQMIPGSGASSPYDSTFPVPLPLGVRFLGAWYPAGTIVRLSIAGFLSFNPATTQGTWPYCLMPDPTLNKLVFPFWTDVKSTGSNNEGIYHRFQITGNNDSIWTIEWRVSTMSPPYGTGNFQLRIYRKSQMPPSYPHYTMFEFDYDNGSPLDRSAPSDSLGAQVGAKSYGQDIGSPGPLCVGADDSKFLLFTGGQAISPYAPAITRLPTRVRGATGYVPDWFANYTSPLSSFFHYTFPDSTCRMKPIDADAAVIKTTDPSSNGSVFPQGNPFTGHVDVFNFGLQNADSIRLNVRVIRGGTVVSDSNYYVFDLIPGGSRNVPISLPAPTGGAYHARATVYLTGDGNALNNSACWTYFVRRSIDGMPTSILSPLLEDELPSSRYVTGVAIPIEIKIMNSGTRNPKRFITNYRIVDAEGTVHLRGSDSVDGNSIDPGRQMRRTVGSFTPRLPGLYYVDIATRATPDSIPENDTLRSIPARDWRSHDESAESRGVCPVPFEVFHPIELAAGDAASYPHLPHAGGTVAGRTPVYATFLNNGGTRAVRMDAHARITDPNGEVVYDRTVMIPAIESGRRTATVHFPDFAPDAEGTYTVTTWLRRADTQLDSVPDNDTAVWRFVVDFGQSDDSDAARKQVLAGVAMATTMAATLVPNPATGSTVLRWSNATAGTARLEVVDLLGATVRSHTLEVGSGAASFRIDVAGLPTGRYTVRLETPDGARRALPLAVRR